METKLREMMERHQKEIENLMHRCPHPPHKVTVYEDGSQIGRGSSTPMIKVTCKLCGRERGYHGLDPSWARNHKTELKTFLISEIPNSVKDRDGFKWWDGVTKYPHDYCEE
jgi:hypothetical protein